VFFILRKYFPFFFPLLFQNNDEFFEVTIVKNYVVHTNYYFLTLSDTNHALKVVSRLHFLMTNRP
jgi:hypothetical protein